jgi:hypothetical protein
MGNPTYVVSDKDATWRKATIPPPPPILILSSVRTIQMGHDSFFTTVTSS